MALRLPARTGYPSTLQTNLTAASRVGTTVTAGTPAHSKNATYTTLLATIDKPTCGIWIRVKEIHGSAAVTGFLLDIAIGAAGSEKVVIPNINCWGAELAVGQHSRLYFFPIMLPAGVRLAATAQSTIASDTGVVAVWLCQDVLYPTGITRVQDYGTVAASSDGQSVPSGNGAFGAWTQVGAATTVRDHHLWSVACDGKGDTTINATDSLVEIGTGVDASNVKSMGVFAFGITGVEAMNNCFPLVVAQSVPAGSKLWARFAAAATESRGVIIYGMD